LRTLEGNAPFKSEFNVLQFVTFGLGLDTGLKIELEINISSPL